MNARAQAGNRAVVRSENLGESSNPSPFEGKGFASIFVEIQKGDTVC